MDFYCLANLTKNYAKNVMEAFYMTSHMHIFCAWNQIDVKQSLTYTAVLFHTYHVYRDDRFDNVVVKLYL